MLENLFGRNMQFRWLSGELVEIMEDGRLGVGLKMPFDDGNYEENVVNYDGTDNLSQSIENRFSGNFNGRLFVPLGAACCKFLQVRYNSKSSSKSVEELRVVTYDHPELNDGRQFVVRSTFHLIAVIRLHRDYTSKDEIRTYWRNGNEIVPAEIVAFRLKEPRAADKQWSIQDHQSTNDWGD
ncbi:hypothetical protein ACEPPN_010876 [Leptodophora sp. 'Broadleaf-Isolate-01']